MKAFTDDGRYRLEFAVAENLRCGASPCGCYPALGVGWHKSESRPRSFVVSRVEDVPEELRDCPVVRVTEWGNVEFAPVD